MSAPWLRVGAALLAIGVAAGAFGAHGLEDQVTPDRLDTWKTGAHYNLIHGLALVALGVRCPKIVGVLLTAGTLIFSGSLYLLVLTDTGWLGAITPLGGVSFIIGWTTLAWRGPKSPQ